jgi:hypothetical protein
MVASLAAALYHSTIIVTSGAGRAGMASRGFL